MAQNQRFFWLFCLLLFVTTAKAQTAGCGRLYVDSAVTTSGNGSSWATALKTVSQALDSANSGSCSSREIWVAKGTYYPMQSLTAIAGSRDSSFRMLRSGIMLYGGFAGGETTLAARSVDTNLTILSGDIGIANDSTDNCYHVVTVIGNGGTYTRLDGFTIKKGNTRASYGTFNIAGYNVDQYQGGGIINWMAYPTIANCTISFNRCSHIDSISATTIGANGGGGVHNHSSSPTITNCTFLSNSSNTRGGAMCNFLSRPDIANCNFISNNANTDGGGIVGTMSSFPITNCVFYNNSAARRGGGVYLYAGGGPADIITNCSFISNSSGSEGGGAYISNSSPSFTNCTFYGNVDTFGSGFYGNYSSSYIRNSILWGNISTGTVPGNYLYGGFPYIGYSITQTSQTGLGNSTANPLFVNTANAIGPDGVWRTSDDGLQLQAGSPAINTGDNAALPTGITTDIMDSIRIRQSIVDMGAYESIPFSCLAGAVVYVDSSRTLSGNGSSWANAYKTLSEGLHAANNCATVTQVWVAKGTYYPMASRTAIAGSRDSSFRILRNGIKLYGGFAGTETALSARNAGANPTVLSGDIGLVGDSTDNCYHVVTVVSNNTIDTNTRLDGLTIKRGNANTIVGAAPFVVAGKNIFSYSGGGLYTAASAPLIKNCTFSFNSSSSTGGGLQNDTASPVILNCTFHSNNSALGGGIYNSLSTPAITNTVFAFNGSSAGGGGVYNAASSPAITNCTFYANSSSTGGGSIWNENASPRITNCILWSHPNGAMMPGIYNSSAASNPVIRYSTTNTFQAGTGNSTANPLFVNIANAIGPDGLWRTGDDGLRLSPCSPDINAGSNAAIPAFAGTDVTGALRIQNTTVDKGAYEMPYNSTGTGVTTVSRSVGNLVCNTTTIIFTATATVPGSLPAYQWYKNGIAVGTNQATYTSNSWNNRDSVWVVHTNNDCSINDTSAKSTILLAPVPAATGAITGNSSPCPGTQTYSVAAVAGATVYSWSVPTGWTITAGQGTPSITVTSTPASGNITVSGSNACLAAPAGSALAVTSLTTPVLPIGPASVCGSSVGNVYSIPAVSGAISYTWTVPAGWVITSGQGTTSITVTAAAGNTSGNISVHASNGCLTGGGAPLAVSGGSLVPALIVGSNSGNTICDGTTVVFTATPINGGTAPTYQWKKNGINAGTNSATYTDANLVNGDLVVVTLTSNSVCAVPASITASGPPIAVVPNVMPAITINGASNVVVCAGAIATFTTSSIAGGPVPTYQWYKNGIAIPGQTASGYTGFGFANGDSVWVVFAPTAACRLVDTVRSNGVVVTVNPNLVPVLTVTANPGTSVPTGATVTFTATITAGGSSATYQWLKNGNAIAGATNSTYTTNTLQRGDLISVRAAALGPCATPNTLTSEPLRISGPAGIALVGVGKGNWKESLLLHPNPSSGRFMVSADWGIVSAGERVVVNMVNGLGQLVFSREVKLPAGKWHLEIELQESVANGLYMLRVQRQSDGSNTALPVLIQR